MRGADFTFFRILHLFFLFKELRDARPRRETERERERGACPIPLPLAPSSPFFCPSDSQEDGDLPADAARPRARSPAGPHRRRAVGPASAPGAPLHSRSHQRDAEVPEAFRRGRREYEFFFIGERRREERGGEEREASLSSIDRSDRLLPQPIVFIRHRQKNKTIKNSLSPPPRPFRILELAREASSRRRHESLREFRE